MHVNVICYYTLIFLDFFGRYGSVMNKIDSVMNKIDIPIVLLCHSLYCFQHLHVFESQDLCVYLFVPKGTGIACKLYS